MLGYGKRMTGLRPLSLLESPGAAARPSGPPFFFFSSRRRHTRWPRDWSSDVCSSDLLAIGSGVLYRDGYLVRHLRKKPNIDSTERMVLAAAKRQYTENAIPANKWQDTAGLDRKSVV